MVAKRDARPDGAAWPSSRRAAIKKTYLALVLGAVVGAQVGRIEAPIGRDPRQRTRAWPWCRTAGPSVTGYRVRERFDGWTLLELDLVTGPDAPDPRPPRGDRPSGRRRPGLRDRRVAARAGGPRAALPARLAARARVADGRSPDPGGGAAAAGAWRRCSTALRAAAAAAMTPPMRRDRGRTRRPAGHHLGPVRRRARTRSSRRCSGAAPGPRLPLRRHLHDARAATGRGRRRVSYHFVTHDAVRATARRRASCSRPTRSTATGTARRAAEVAAALAAGHDVILKIDVQGAQVRQGARPGGPAHLRGAAVARGARSSACARARPSRPTSSSRASATPPSSWPARTTTTTSWSTRRARWSGRPSGSTRSSPPSAASIRTAGSWSSAGRRSRPSVVAERWRAETMRG